MNVYPYTVFNTVLKNYREAIPFILSSVSLYPEEVNLQMEDIKQDIQDATSDYLVSTYITGKSLLDTPDDTIKYIKTFIHPHHSYSIFYTT